MNLKKYTPNFRGSKNIFKLLSSTLTMLAISLISAGPAIADPVAVTVNTRVGCELTDNSPIYTTPRILAYPPIAVTSSEASDIAYWRPVLYRWDGATWVEHMTPPSHVAYADIRPGGINQGLNGGWRSVSTHGQANFAPFYNLESGEYQIYHEIHLSEANLDFYSWSTETCTIP